MDPSDGFSSTREGGKFEVRFRQVERIGDANVMYSAVAISDAELERSFTKDY